MCVCVGLTPDGVTRLALSTCFACQGSGVRNIDREKVMKRNSNRRIPTAQKYFTFDGAHCKQIYAGLPADWQCPACRRNKYQIMRWTLLYPNSPAPYEGWAAGYHKYHDHGAESGVAPRFEQAILCEQCNSADASAKRKLNLPKQFSFSPKEIAQFVAATPHGWHLLDYDRASQIYAAVQEAARAPTNKLGKKYRMRHMAAFRISKYMRIDPAALIEKMQSGGDSIITGPVDLIATLKPKYGLVVAAWDGLHQLGRVSRYGVVLAVRQTEATVTWSYAETSYRPNPAGRRWWTQTKPFFGFAPDVAERYMLAAAFAEHFPEDLPFEESLPGTTGRQSIRPSSSPTGGYVYLVRSKYGVKIGKSVNVRNRTRLFEVKLPFPITVEHYAWFDDYSFAERELHQKYHAKRLEGEWFALSENDVDHIKTLGKLVSVVGM